jgi:hypothetical protein
MLSSATKKEPSPHAIARPVVAEAGATKSIHQAKESRLVAKTKVPLRANAVIKTGSKRRASGAVEKISAVLRERLRSALQILPRFHRSS